MMVMDLEDLENITGVFVWCPSQPGEVISVYAWEGSVL